MIHRTLKNDIINHLDKKEITIITGPRQAGKTTLMHEIGSELKAKNEKLIFFNLDIDTDSRYFTSQELVVKKINLELGNSGYVFIDEIQRLENAGLFLKGLYDRNLKYKFIVSGSGSIELKEKIHESLAGRKRMFVMNTVSFREFVNYKTLNKYEDQLHEFFEVEQQKTDALLHEYMNYGGYPRIVTEPLQSEKFALMNEIFQSYIEKDLVYLLRIERPDVFRMLIRILASQTGNIINYNELAKHSGLAVPTLKRYLWYAEKTFSIHLITPFYTNTLKEITKSPACYFCDLGLRNFALGQIGKLELPNQMGFVFQNFIFQLLTDNKLFGESLQFWRTKDKAEVDFILNKKGNPLPVEVKYSNFTKPEISRSFRSFIEKYKPDEAWVINRNYNSMLQINGTKVIFMAYYKLV